MIMSNETTKPATTETATTEVKTKAKRVSRPTINLAKYDKLLIAAKAVEELTKYNTVLSTLQDSTLTLSFTIEKTTTNDLGESVTSREIVELPVDIKYLKKALNPAKVEAKKRITELAKKTDRKISGKKKVAKKVEATPAV